VFRASTHAQIPIISLVRLLHDRLACYRQSAPRGLVLPFTVKGLLFDFSQAKVNITIQREYSLEKVYHKREIKSIGKLHKFYCLF
jgi:hypothetical protein